MPIDRPPRYSPDLKPKDRPRHPQRHVWTLRRGADVRTCEIHEDKANKAWDVQTYDNGWLSYARRVSTRPEALELATALREDCLREAWSEDA